MTIPQFPRFTGRTTPTKKTIDVQSTRLSARTGRRFAQPNWPYPVYHYEMDLAFLREGGAYEEVEQFEGFWKSMMTTPGQLFVFIDNGDSIATNQFIGTGDGTRVLWQAMRTRGGFIEPVTAVLQNDDPPTSFLDCGAVTSGVTQTIDNGAVTDAVTTTTDNGRFTFTHFYVNGVEVDVTIFDSGALRFTIPPADGAAITWTGLFGWLCQPDEDTAELDVLLPQIYEIQQFTFTTARPNV